MDVHPIKNGINRYRSIPICYWKKCFGQNPQHLPRVQPVELVAFLSAPPPVSHRHQRLFAVVPQLGQDLPWIQWGSAWYLKTMGKNMKHHWHLMVDQGWSRLIMVDNGHLGGRFAQALIPQYVDVKMLQSTPPPKEKYTLGKILCDLFGAYCNVAKPIMNHPQWWFMTLDVPL